MKRRFAVKLSLFFTTVAAHQGKIRRIILKNEEGHILIDIPLTVGVVGGAIGAAFFPILAWDRLPLILLKII
jgi:hypothetical protein